MLQIAADKGLNRQGDEFHLLTTVIEGHVPVFNAVDAFVLKLARLSSNAPGKSTRLRRMNRSL